MLNTNVLSRLITNHKRQRRKVWQMLAYVQARASPERGLDYLQACEKEGYTLYKGRAHVEAGTPAMQIN